jgi:peptidoglycan/LPS O-acetylase OafA/YrhL
MTAGDKRYDFLDWLRVIAIFVLLFFHTGMLFVGWGWHIENGDVIAALERPMDIAHRLRMPLLFVIAGAGMWFALRNRSAAQVLVERSLRLLLPLVVGMFVIVAPQVYMERLFRGEWSGGYGEFFFERVLLLTPYPQGDFSWHHLWFVAYLYVYVLVLLPALAWWRRRAPTVRPHAWLYALSLPLALNEALLKPHFPETHALIGDWYIFNHYLLLTLFGFLLASMSGAWEWLETQRRRAFVAAVAVLVLALALFESGLIARDTPADALIANIFTWLCLMAFLGYGRRYLSFSNPLLRWARDASYPVYILHQTVIVIVGYYVVQQPWAAWTKFWFVLAVTMASCFVLYESLIRRYVWSRVMFGMKATAGAAPTRASREASAA